MSDPFALQNKGQPITLEGGRVVLVKFDLEALAQLEEDFGSLDAWAESLNSLQGATNFKAFGLILKMLRAGLLHDPTAANAKFELARVQEYCQAIFAAIEQGFPKGMPASEAAVVPAQIVTDPSPGTTSTSSEPPASVVPIASSGA